MLAKIRLKTKGYLLNLRYSVTKIIAPLLPDSSAKIYDCFLFNNELDILLLRLRELHNIVDYFVVAECQKTFTGEDKPLVYRENIDKYVDFKSKIIHFVIPNPPEDAYVTNPANARVRTSEFWQRNQLKCALDNINGDDLILVSDVDEIPRASKLSYVKKVCRYSGALLFLSQDWYLLFLNIRVKSKTDQVFKSSRKLVDQSHQAWIGTFACSAKTLRKRFNSNLNAIWSMKWGEGNAEHPTIKNAGWHFSYMGGIEALISKVNDNGNNTYTNQDVQELAQGNFIGCSLKIDEVGITHPGELLTNPTQWKHLLTDCKDFSELAVKIQLILSR